MRFKFARRSWFASWLAGFALVSVLFLVFVAKAEAAFDKATGCEILTLATGKKVALHYQLPDRLASSTRVLFVCHGVKRNPEKYLRDWSEAAKKLGVILIAPGFSKKEFPKGKNYNQGGIQDDKGKLASPDTWAFSAIEKAFFMVKERFGLDSQQYLIYGHSAGAQFVHRLVIFLPNTSLGLAIAANAGSLTFTGSTARYPYGMPDTIALEQLKLAFARRLVLMLGEKDIDPAHKYLNNSSLAKKQGPNRLARGRNFFADAKAMAMKNNFAFNWKKVEVPGIGHSNRGMSRAAVAVIAEFLASGSKITSDRKP